MPVKSEVLWPSHLTSKVHRNNVRLEKEQGMELERQQMQEQQEQDGSRKRSLDEAEVDDEHEQDGKRTRVSQAEGAEQDEPSTSTPALFLPAGFFSDPSQAPSFPTDPQDEDTPEDDEWAAYWWW